MTRSQLKSEQVPAAHAMEGYDLGAVFRELQATRRDVAELKSDLLAIRQERLPAPPNIIEDLCRSTAAVVGDKTFTALHLLHEATGGSKDAERLAGAITRAIGHRRSVPRLARFLTRACGTFGPWRLLLYRESTNNGNVFRIVYIH